MFNKILIANRGEIAVRIIRACHEMGIKTVAVYSEADKSALHAYLADEAFCIGPPASKDSYLKTQALLAACEVSGAQAIHPGYGFLSESPDFARLCQKCGIKWVGPSPEAMEALGDKANAKQTMVKAGVPVVPGSDGVVKDFKKAKKIAKDIGYPIMVKASAGGGGRGIRFVQSEAELEEAMDSAKRDAINFFGNGDLYIEKFIVDPKHVEIQLFADEHGNVVHMGERDCSCQRRNQKVLEESPSPVVDEALRKKMGEAAVSAAKACGYSNAGTIEFLLDKEGNFYFMEMNARIQVEHPVTEIVTGIDLIKSQLRVAAGEKLPWKQKDIKLSGHVIECRVNAEDPANNFRPCPGKIQSLHLPGGFGVRIDSAIYQSYVIPPYYDSMLAKVIVRGENRDEAIKKMKVALSEFLIEGIVANIDFQLEILRDETFLKGDYDIGFLGRRG